MHSNFLLEIWWEEISEAYIGCDVDWIYTAEDKDQYEQGNELPVVTEGEEQLLGSQEEQHLLESSLFCIG